MYCFYLWTPTEIMIWNRKFMKSYSMKLSTELHHDALLPFVGSSDLNEPWFIPKGHRVPWFQVNLLAKVPVKSMTVAHVTAKLTLPDNFLHYRIKTEELAWSANQETSDFLIFETWDFSAVTTPFLLKNKNVYKVCYRCQNSLGCLYMQMWNENFSTYFLETSVLRPKVNRKSLWTQDCYITNVRRMFAWSKSSHSLKKYWR